MQMELFPLLSSGKLLGSILGRCKWLPCSGFRETRAGYYHSALGTGSTPLPMAVAFRLAGNPLCQLVVKR